MPVKQRPIRTSFFNFDFILLERVRVEFGLDSPLALRPILMDGPTAALMEVRSKTSRKALIATPAQRFFLKEVPWYCDTPEFLAFSHALQEQLHIAGVPVPGLCRTRSGLTWLEYNDRRLTLTPFVKGKRFQFSAPEARAAGIALRNIHMRQNLAALPAYSGDDFVQLIRDHVDLIHIERPDVAAALGSHVIPRFRSLADEFASRLAASGFSCIPDVAVHGDFNPWNVSFTHHASGPAVAGIFDFDNSDRHPRLHDLAEGLVTFSGAIAYRSDSTRFAAPVRRVSPDMAGAFLAGYDLSLLSVQEARLLPYVGGLIGIEFACLGLLRNDFLPTAGEELADWVEHLPYQVEQWMGLSSKCGSSVLSDS